jgi:hypothetical protein
VCAEAGGKIYVANSHYKLKNGLKTAVASAAVASSLLPLSDPRWAGQGIPCDLASIAGRSTSPRWPSSIIFQIPVPDRDAKSPVTAPSSWLLDDVLIELG